MSMVTAQGGDRGFTVHLTTGHTASVRVDAGSRSEHCGELGGDVDHAEPPTSPPLPNVVAAGRTCPNPRALPLLQWPVGDSYSLVALPARLLRLIPRVWLGVVHGRGLPTIRKYPGQDGVIHTVWVPETVHTPVDLPLRRPLEPGMICRWH